MDVFPDCLSDRVVAVSHPGKWDPFESLMQQGRIQAFISFMEPTSCQIFHQPIQEWSHNHLYVENLKRAVKASQIVNYFNPKQVKWAKVCKKLRSNLSKNIKSSDQRMNFKMDNLFLVKQYFSFGLWTVPEGEGHVMQTSDVPMLVYELQQDCMSCTPKPITVRRSFSEIDECYYKQFVLRPNSAYVVPPGSNYILLTVQKSLFGVDRMPWDLVQNIQDFRSHKDFKVQVYNLPPPTPRREEERPKMVRPEERLARKRQRVQEPIVEEPLVQETLQYWAPEPIHQDPEPMVLETEYVNQEPVLEEPTQADFSMPNWQDILESKISPETISDFLNNFEREVGEISEGNEPVNLHLNMFLVTGHYLE